MSTVCLLSHADPGPFLASEWDLSPDHSLLLPVQPGDLLQALQGTVWITVDGDPRDLLLARGELHIVARAATLYLSGFDAPRLKLLSRRAVQADPWRDAPGWRHWLLWASGWARRRLDATA